MEKVATPEVQVDQVWKDNDKRNPERYLLVKRIVERVGNPLAECVVGFPDAQGVNAIAWTKRTTCISLRRFRPNATGYVLVA